MTMSLGAAVPSGLVLVLCGLSFLAGRYIQQAGELPAPNEVRSVPPKEVARESRGRAIAQGD